jgi:hypothetical protein
MRKDDDAILLQGFVRPFTTEVKSCVGIDGSSGYSHGR